MKRTITCLLAVVALTFAIGCNEKSPIEKTTDSIEDGAKRVSDSIEHAYDKTKDAVKSGAEAVKDGVKTGVEKTGEAFDKAEEEIKKVVK